MKVDVAAVEEELARMQRELTNSEVRTSLFNLVVMSPDARRAMVDEALNYLLGKRAARVIHIVGTDDEKSDLEVSARCFVDHEHKGVCFQEIIITSGRDGAGGAPGSWIPLLVRDIPTYILWLDTISGKQELFAHVQQQADKVIVDADHCVSLGDDPDELLALLADVTVRGGVPLTDFSWKRLRSYRSLAAAAFEPPERRELLGEIERVEVTGLAPVTARLFGLWFAERLGWTLVDGTGSPIPFRDAHGRPVRLVMHQGERECDVDITVGLTGERCIDITAGLNGCADVDFEGGREEHLLVLPTNGEILLEEVDAVYADDLYSNALSVIQTHAPAP